ncbi:MAG: hypothetical protein GY715_17340 [Planctomycetes bacterium]|nr:hypothetical protein [Planctomycetota bacterium]
MRRRVVRPKLLALLVLPLLAGVPGGCAVAQLVGGMMQNAEYQKQVQTPARYDLEGYTIAVLVDADLGVLSMYPRLIEQVTSGVTLRIARDVPGVVVTHPSRVLDWQWKTPQWNAMPYGKIAEQLNVDRVILVDVYEYRLHPPGDRWLWEGVCAANVSVIERDAFDPDMIVDTYDVTSNFPTVSYVDRSSASAGQIETGLLSEFIKRTAWLFHEHLEPKYPDKFRPEAA